MISIALIDGPLEGADTPAQRHALGLVAALQQNCQNVQIDSFPVFDGMLSTSVRKVTDALIQAHRQRPDIVLCSLGLTRRDSGLSSALEQHLQQGSLIVASRPARSPHAVWPAAHPDVYAVQGDARCEPTQFSRLGPEHWFGACPSVPGNPDVAGASIAAAHFAGILATALTVIPDGRFLPSWIKANASWLGREHRTAQGRATTKQ